LNVCSTWPVSKLRTCLFDQFCMFPWAQGQRECCKSIFILWSLLFDTLYFYLCLKRLGGLGTKFLNGGQTSTINTEKITDHYCYRWLRQFICEKNANFFDKIVAIRPTYNLGAVTLIRAKYASPWRRIMNLCE
jgi:hypothetical protein